MKKAKGIIYNMYSYLIPTMVLLVYIGYIAVRSSKNQPIVYVQDSKGFEELCKAITSFSSIVLGIYGFFVPMIIGKQEDDFVARFWSVIDRDKFSKDMKKVIFSGILTILLSSTLLIYDILPFAVVNAFVCALIWLVLFFSCCSYRFIGIFINLVVGKEKKKDLDKTVNIISEDRQQKIKDSFETF